MRTYAAFIAADKKAVVDCIFNGDPIKNLKDKDGKKMTDGHLKDKRDFQNSKGWQYCRVPRYGRFN